jgi:hypothetical protein
MLDGQLILATIYLPSKLALFRDFLSTRLVLHPDAFLHTIRGSGTPATQIPDRITVAHPAPTLLYMI